MKDFRHYIIDKYNNGPMLELYGDDYSIAQCRYSEKTIRYICNGRILKSTGNPPINAYPGRLNWEAKTKPSTSFVI